MSGWRAALNGAVLVGDSASPPASGTVVGCLTKPPDGLGLPGLRTEDVTYPQRDGVEHFSDWYEPRIVTLDEVSIGGTGCDCESPRAAARDLMVAWSRQCDDVELVLWPPDCDSDDPELTGPYGVVGRPRVAQLTWVGGTDKNIADATLRFDAVDHRLYLLDANGTPGSGGLCQSASPTQPNQTFAQFAASSALVNQHYPLSISSRDPNSLYGPDSSGIIDYPDAKFDAGSVIVDDATSTSGWAVSSTGPGSPTPTLVTASGLLKFEALYTNVGGAYTLTVTRTGSVTMTGTPILWFRYTASYSASGAMPAATPPSITASFSGGSFSSPVREYLVNGTRIVGFVAPASFTSVAFRFSGTVPAASSGSFMRITGLLYEMGRAKSRGAGRPYTTPTPQHGLPQIATGLASSSYNGEFDRLGLFNGSYTTGMIGGFLASSVPGGDAYIGFNIGSGTHIGSFTYTAGVLTGNLRWNSTNFAPNAFLLSVVKNALDQGTPLFLGFTWNASNLWVWTSVDNPSIPATPKLAQTVASAGTVPAMGVFGYVSAYQSVRISDVVAGVDQYGTLATVNTFVDTAYKAGMGLGAAIPISEAGNVCSDLVITFTGNNTNPKIQDASGNFVGVQGTFTTGTTVVLDTSTGTLTINGAVSNSLITGDPFFSAAPGDILQAFGGGSAQVCWRPAVMSA